MREERGTLSGNRVISEPLDLWGNISGNVHIVDGGKVYLRGNIYGDLTVTHGGRTHIYGNVTGTLRVKEGAKVIVSGVIGGDCINLGGRLFLDATARIQGKLRMKEGHTEVDPKAQYHD